MFNVIKNSKITMLNTNIDPLYSWIHSQIIAFYENPSAAMENIITLNVKWPIYLIYECHRVIAQRYIQICKKIQKFGTMFAIQVTVTSNNS